MPKDRKTTPQLPPPDSLSLRHSLAQALGDETVARRICITLRVSGGMPSLAYLFEFGTTGGTAVHCQMNCRSRDRHHAVEDSMLAKGEFSRLLKLLQASRILEKVPEPPKFLPDTLVGVLEISDGKSTQRNWFAADEAQASVQQTKMPPKLGKLVNAIYALGAKLLKQRTIKP